MWMNSIAAPWRPLRPFATSKRISPGSWEEEKEEHIALMRSSLQDAFHHLSLYTLLMVLAVILIAIFMAAVLTTRITTVVQGFRRFQKGDRSYRLKRQSNDEMGQLTDAYNEMADTVQTYISDVEASKARLEQVNTRLENEILERRRAQDELSRNRDNLEIMVKERTRELEKEIVERRRVEKLQQESEARLRDENSALLHLAGNEVLYQGDLNRSLDAIVPLAAQTLRVDRCGVWLLDEKGMTLECRKLIIKGNACDPEKHFVSGADLQRTLKLFQRTKTIAADDALHDDRLADLALEYLPSRGIRSLLVANVREGGHSSGLISFAQLSGQRNWHLDEINFANSVADIIGLAIGAANRKVALEEKAQLTSRLRRAEKMEAIGTLAGGVAHDLNNILSGIVSYPELLLLKLPEDSSLREPVNTIFKSGKRAATIVQDLLTLARRGLAVTEVVNLNGIVEEFLQSPEYSKMFSYHPRIRIKTRLEPELLNVLGSPVHLAKALMNLVSNAAEAMDEEGRIVISTRNCYIDRPFKGYDVVNEGDYAALTVRDTGTGIPPEDLNRIFEPFYTKKKMGRSGTGLGMAVVWGTVKDHQGYIDFDSREGDGSRFTLYFPVTRKSREDASAKSMEAYMGKGETVLVVDDVEEQRKIASAILTTLGYRVQSVESGEAAVQYIDHTSVDLMVLDMIMDPGMDGLDTYQQVLQRRPNQKAIIASGFSETDRIREVLRLGASSYLKKPYTIEKIGTAIRSALDAS
jgi:signal transduction histidine kinase/CheY-like chemotaxis protein/HAMP domain-containing protein